MPKALDGAVMDESSSDNGTITPAGEAEKEAGKCKDPNPASGAGACPCQECRPHSPGPIDELITALHEATLGPVRPR